MTPPDPPRTPEGAVRRWLGKVRAWGGPELRRAAILFLVTFLLGLGYGFVDIRSQKAATEAIQSVPPVEGRPGTTPAAAAPEAEGHEEVSLPAQRVRSVLVFARNLFLHNLTAAGVTAALGLLAGLLSYIPVGVNGGMLGYWCSGWIFLQGARSLGILVWLLPHGLFEIPAFLIAAALGARLSRVAKDQGVGGRVTRLVQAWRAQLLIIALLGLAALIESWNGYGLYAGWVFPGSGP